jgi:hypothetical protein
MKTMALYLLMLSTQQNITQTVGKPTPGFTLTLEEAHVAGIAASYQALMVAHTNISTKTDYESYCGAFGGLYHLIVMYNGVPIRESKETTKHRQIAESGRCLGRGSPARNLQPAQSREDYLYYHAVKSGTYAFTVEEKAFLGDSSSDVTVKSNTVTIVVPKP